MTGVVRGQRGLGIGGHHAPSRGEKDVWLTPPELIAALGPFDLDPCAPVDRPWDTATRHLTVDDDGLVTPWPADAFVWCNPPYGPETWAWLDLLAAHPAGGIALVFARTETAGFFASVWAKATSILFIEGRLYFHHADGRRAAANAGGPSCLIAYGPTAYSRLYFAHGTTIHGAHLALAHHEVVR
jgi:hypothetical protein